jgi:uncharacterized OsmC-like protein
MSKTRTTIVNGVDTEKLFGNIAAITADPALAKFQFRLVNQWVGGGENRSRIYDFYGTKQEMRHKQPFFLINDEPEALLSEDRGANPVEYVLHALAGCLTTGLVYHAAAQGIAVKHVTTRFEGDLDLRGFLGADCDEAKKRELLATVQTVSPVFDIVSNGVPVTCMLDDGTQAKAA